MIQLNTGQFTGIGLTLLLVVQSFLGWNPEITSGGFGIMVALILYYVARLTEIVEGAVEGDSE